MRNPDIIISCLKFNPQFVPAVAQWIFKEFIYGQKKAITYEMIRDNFSQRGIAKLPICLIAVDDGKCVGTASLVASDLKFGDYSPWLAALYVEPAKRRKGIGRILIEAVREVARELDYKEIFLYTKTAAEYYRNLEWEHLETLDDELGNSVEVFRKDL